MHQLVQKEALKDFLESDQQRGRDLLQRLVYLYSNDSPKRLMSLVVNLKVGNLDQVRIDAHTLKSSSASLGAVAVHECAAKIEEVVSYNLENPRSEIEPLVQELHKAMLPTIKELKQLSGEI